MKSVLAVPLGLETSSLRFTANDLDQTINNIKQFGLPYLEKEFKPSTVGHDGKNEIDTQVRKSFTKVYYNFGIRVKSRGYSDEYDTHSIQFQKLVISKIQDLVPEKYRSCIYEITTGLECKQIVYPTGGFFAKHTDGISNRSHFATVLILIPNLPHTGGVLRIWDVDGQLHSFASETYTEPMIVAFHPQLEHECTEITSGYRMVIKFEMHLDVDAMDLIDRLDASAETPLPTHYKTTEDLEADLLEKLEEFRSELDAIIDQAKSSIRNIVANSDPDRVRNHIIDRLKYLKRDIVDAKSSIRDIKEIIPKSHDPKMKYLISKIATLAQQTEAKKIAVQLANYYPNENPEFFYADDSKMYLHLRRTYGKVAVINDSFESQEDYYNRYNRIDPNDYHIVECFSEAGTRETRSEYNDETYDKIYTYHVTYLIIDPSKK